jgi:hypothetical protein
VKPKNKNKNRSCFFSLSLWEEMWVGTKRPEITQQYQCMMADSLSASQPQPSSRKLERPANHAKPTRDALMMLGNFYAQVRCKSTRVTITLDDPCYHSGPHMNKTASAKTITPAQYKPRSVIGGYSIFVHGRSARGCFSS